LENSKNESQTYDSIYERRKCDFLYKALDDIRGISTEKYQQNRNKNPIKTNRFLSPGKQEVKKLDKRAIIYVGKSKCAVSRRTNSINSPRLQLGRTYGKTETKLSQYL